jgi:hypothetical protein
MQGRLLQAVVRAYQGKPYQGEAEECSNSTTRGYTMPAFTFEKITPPVRRGSIPSTSSSSISNPSSSNFSSGTNSPIVKKQRSVIVQIIDRFVEVRIKRGLRGQKG